MYKNFESRNQNYKKNIPKEHAHTIKTEFEKVNFKRIRIFSYVVFLFELLLMIFYDIPRILDNPSQIIYQVYFGLHFLTFITSIVALYLLHRHKRYPQKNMPKYFVEIVTFLFLFWMAIIGFLDLVRSDQIISYISMLTLAGIAVLIKPPRNYIVYSVPHILFLSLSFYFIENRYFFTGNLINTTMYFFCILVLSRIVYENQLSHIIKNIALIEANEELEYLSNHDSLTEISNRRYFETQVKASHLNRQQQAVLTMVDLDYFKKVNDQYGHSVGDIVLKEVAATMKTNIRHSDFLARWGGEEFIILFTNSSLKQAQDIVERMRKAIEAETIIVHGDKISITASFGMCEFKSQTMADINQSYRKADRLLYQAKKNGRNRIEVE